MSGSAAEAEAHLYVHSWNVEDRRLQVVGFGLQRGRAFLASEQMSGGGVGGLKLLLLRGRLLVQTPEASLAAPVRPTGKRHVCRIKFCWHFPPLRQLDGRSFCVRCLSTGRNSIHDAAIYFTFDETIFQNDYERKVRLDLLSLQ